MLINIFSALYLMFYGIAVETPVRMGVFAVLPLGGAHTIDNQMQPNEANSTGCYTHTHTNT